MILHIQIADIHEEVLCHLPVSGIIGLIFWWEMFFILDNETISLLSAQRNMTFLKYMIHVSDVRSWTNLKTLDNLLYTYYFVWFLISSLILLVAIIRVIILTMHKTTVGSMTQNPWANIFWFLLGQAWFNWAKTKEEKGRQYAQWPNDGTQWSDLLLLDPHWLQVPTPKSSQVQFHTCPPSCHFSHTCGPSAVF